MERVTYNITGVMDPTQAALPLFRDVAQVLGIEDAHNAVIELQGDTMIVQVLEYTTAAGVASNLQAWRGLHGDALPIRACLEHLRTHCVWISGGTVAGMLWPRCNLET